MNVSALQMSYLLKTCLQSSGNLPLETATRLVSKQDLISEQGRKEKNILCKNVMLRSALYRKTQIIQIGLERVVVMTRFTMGQLNS